MDKNKRVEICMPIVFFLIAIYIFVTAQGLPGVEGVFPSMISVVMLLSSLTIFIKNLRNSKSVIDVAGINWLNIAKVAAALLVYIFIFDLLGYVLSTVLLGSFIVYSLGVKDIKNTLLYPLLIVVILFIVFKMLLNIPLPTLFLDI